MRFETRPYQGEDDCARMRRLKALGAVNAFVASWHARLPANRIYERSGFQLVDHQRKWVKTYRIAAT